VKNEPPKYRSSKSVAKNQTIPIDINDPRLKPGKIGMVRARSGAEIEIVNLANINANSANIGVLNGTINPTNTSPDIIIPPLNNLPPSVYPGGSGPQVIVLTDPSSVTAAWSGDTLNISFTWDPTIGTNATASQFIISLTDTLGDVKTYGGFPIATGTTAQTITVTPSINESMFNIFTPTLTAISIKVADPLNNTSNFVASASIPSYTLNLSTPTIAATATSSGYSIAYTTPSSSSFSGIDIWEIESSASSAPTITYQTDGITPSNYNRVYFNSLNPAIIKTVDYNKRWVIARFSSNGQVYTAFSNAVSVTPTSPVSVSSISQNWPIQTGGSIYSGSIDGNGNLTSSGYIINNNGLTFYNGSANTTTINGSTGLLQTISANIGGWNVDQYTINKTGLTGKGNIVLDSQNGYIYVSDSNTPNYTAGINSASTSDAIVFWAGQGLTGSQPNPASASNSFKVSMGGTLYASGAQITGKITSTSGGTSGNTITLDSANDYISLSNGTNAAYIIPRNNNLYITAPSSSSPFSSGTLIPSSGPTTGSYLSTGSNFSDYWGNRTIGAGIFTGSWDYFTTGSSKPFMTATSTGIQLSASPSIGILVDAGSSATGNRLSSSNLNLNGIPSILLYTSKDSSAPYSPSTQYGAWMQMSPGQIDISSNQYIGITLTQNHLRLYSTVATNTYYYFTNGDLHYSSPNQYIDFGSTGLSINGLNVYGDQSLSSTPSFVRSIVRSPDTNYSSGITGGDAVVGYAIYYSPTSALSGGSPSVSSGYVGDLWVAY
jgi:hypothetical protein